MQVRRRPREHSRTLRSGKRIVINRGIRSTANKVIRNIRKSTKRIQIAGSIRRKKAANDIDLVVVPIDKDAILDKIKKMGNILASGDRQIFAKVDGTKVDIFFATPKEFGAQLMTRTGPAGANIKNRTIAREKGMLLNQYGLFNRKTGKRLAISERGIYRHLGKSYRPPEKRGSPRKSYGIRVTHPSAIGSRWSGPGYIHGPRRIRPEQCTKFRVGKKSKSGKRLIFCQLKNGKWAIQSTLTPRRKG